MANVLKQLGLNIKRLRKAADINQDELAKRLSVTPGAVSQWEGGAVDVPLTRLSEIAGALGVKLAELVSDVETKAPARTLDSLRLEAIQLLAVADLADVTGVLLTLKGEPRS